MSLISGRRGRWRRHRLAGYAVIPLGLALVGVMYASISGHGGQAAASAPAGALQSIARGRYLFEQNCSSCHGMLAQGKPGVAPSLIGAGAAAVDFQVSTGRMPAKEQGAENDRKPPAFSHQDIYDIASFVASLGGGPDIPGSDQVSTSGANVGLGQQLFTANCAACHNFVGAGGALTFGKYAPDLNQSTPVQIYEAMVTGPEAMPVFNDTTITPQEKRDIIAYVTETRAETNPGGFSLGRIGPVTEGLVAWLGGIGLLVLAAIWIAGKRREEHE
ncbi:MAG TPA: c-type cytochrome [Streptosporangiaceae bacterium]|nr:c-type cytochrome [Streptosporangiaceae bacterium]